MRNSLPLAAAVVVGAALAVTGYMYAENEHTKALNAIYETSVNNSGSLNSHSQALNYHSENLERLNERISKLERESTDAHADLEIIRKDLIEIKRTLKKWDDAQNKASIREDDK